MAISSLPKNTFWKPLEPGCTTHATEGVFRPAVRTHSARLWRSLKISFITHEAAKRMVWRGRKGALGERRLLTADEVEVEHALRKKTTTDQETKLQ